MFFIRVPDRSIDVRFVGKIRLSIAEDAVGWRATQATDFLHVIIAEIRAKSKAESIRWPETKDIRSEISRKFPFFYLYASPFLNFLKRKSQNDEFD